MSLNFNLAKIKNYETVCLNESGDIKSLTQTLIFATISVGLGEISDKNLNKFLNRLRAVELAAGPFLINRGMINAEDLRAHVGLSTNASPLSDTKFTTHIGRMVLRQAGHSVNCDPQASAPEELANASG